MELGLFLLHAVVGSMFAAHGAQKLFGAFGGYGIEGTGGFMESLGLRPGKVHAVAAGVAEFGGGVLLALGLLVPLAATLIVAAMAVAVAKVHVGKGPFNENGGWELNVLYATVAVGLAGAGAGEWSLDAVLDLDVAGTGWALGALGAGLLGAFGALTQGRLVTGSGGAEPSSA